MGRTFTLVSCNDHSSIHPGFIEAESLEEIEDLMYEVGSAIESTEIELYYMMYLDYENAPVEEATEEEIGILNERLLDFYDSGFIDVLDIVKIPIDIKNEDEEIIDMFYM